MVNDLLVTLGVSLGINSVLFLLAFRYKTDRLTDISYAVSFVALALYAVLQGEITPARFLLYTMIFMWAARLGAFLLVRIWRTGIDYRFDNIRTNFWKFGHFWLAQGVSVWVIMLASLLAFAAPDITVNWLSIAGVAIWGLGLLIESSADMQKYRFNQLSYNKNKWIDIGLWRYSRHPNYFGEMLVWSGVYIAVLPTLSLVNAGVALISPLFIIVLLLFVSGIPPLERLADERWGQKPGYIEYKRRTSVLIPWFRRRATPPVTK